MKKTLPFLLLRQYVTSHQIMLQEDDSHLSFDDESDSPFLRAVREGNLHKVQHMLNHGADVSLKNPDGETALHYASYCDPSKSYEIYELLLKHDADCNDRSFLGDTPFHRALENGNLEIVELLLIFGADVHAVDFYGESSLHYAARNFDVEVIQHLLELGVDIESKDGCGYSALHCAVISGNPGVCEILLKCGAAVNSKSTPPCGQTPLTLAVRPSFEDSRTPEIVQVLLDYGADVADRAAGESVLQIAAWEGGNDVVRRMLVRHLVRLECLGSNIDEDDRLLIRSMHCYRECYVMCLQEVRDMKELKIYKNVSVFGVLMGNTRVVAGYARNEELVKAFEEKKYDNFPIYFSWLKERFLLEVKRQTLRKSAAQSLFWIFKFNDPSHLVIQRILDYLRDDDLVFLRI